MRAIRRTSAVVAAVLLIAACGGGGPTSSPVIAVDPTAPTCGEPAAGTAADVEATVSGNTWGPVTAANGDVITWTNADGVPHKVALDDGSCTMSANITGEAPQSLVFHIPGSYPFHCTVHPSMKGTIIIS